MTTCSDANATSFDPYGEPLGEDRITHMVQADRRARNAAIAIFWTLALTLTAGRVYLNDQPLGHTLTLVQAKIAAFVSAMR
ncbi:hypothetical protein MBUL_02249 [Methylobacterium bullatum]|uniref:Uncharacterized protein n=1 Tax=Methylobacterium bullatum TaxID=570505 RepID=A0A679J4V6_9HYPH|nr:hypothetical protein MBUL_02249 [Methylobacterium bullatum]